MNLKTMAALPQQWGGTDADASENTTAKQTNPVPEPTDLGFVCNPSLRELLADLASRPVEIQPLSLRAQPWGCNVTVDMLSRVHPQYGAGPWANHLEKHGNVSLREAVAGEATAFGNLQGAPAWPAATLETNPVPAAEAADLAAGTY